MTRQERRAAERKQRKIARKQEQQNPASAPAVSTDAPMPEAAPSNSSRPETNRANAQHSTGPKSPEGKAASSQNSFKHGLYSKQLVIAGESAAELDTLKASLFAEHQPATITEQILVNEMAEHYWRLRRARLAEVRLLETACRPADMNAVARLMSAAERGFYKALKALRDLQLEPGFVPQNQDQSAPSASASPTVSTAHAGFVPQNDNEIPDQPVDEDYMHDEFAEFEARMDAYFSGKPPEIAA